MSKVMFLPPVVTTSVKDVDNTKEDVDDAEMKRIMAKYGGYVDEKEVNIEKMVEVMAARRGTEGAAAQPQHAEQPAPFYGNVIEVKDDKPQTVVHVEKENHE